MRQRAELDMSAGLDQVHPRQRVVRVMVMMAVVEMRQHYTNSIGPEGFWVNSIWLRRLADFSIRSNHNLDDDGIRIQPLS
jgi:hypothetical protein